MGTSETALKSLFEELPPARLRSLLKLRDDTGLALVHSAAAAGDVKLLARLLAADASQLEWTDSRRRSPLGVAVASLQPAAAQHICGMYSDALARQTAAQAALKHLLTELPGSPISAAGVRPCADPARLRGTLAVLLGAGATLAQCTTYLEGGFGEVPLIYTALHRGQPDVALVLLEHGAAASRGDANDTRPQPLHALALGLAHGGRQLPPQQVLQLVQQLIRRGARIDAKCTTSFHSFDIHLRSSTALGCLVEAAAARTLTSPSLLTILSTIDYLLKCGADPCAADARSGASLTATSAAGMTPLGQLLRHAHYHCIGPCALNAARAVLQAGSTLQAAGGGQAWQAVLKQALWCSADHAPRQQALMTELVGLLLGCGCTNDRSHAGLTPLGHLLAAALTEMLVRAMVRMEAGSAVVQLEAPTSSRLAQLAQQLLQGGADPNGLDVGRATEAALVMRGAMEDESDDEELLPDSDGEDAPHMQPRTQVWCLQRLATRQALASACQSPLRQSIKLHDFHLTKLLLAAGAAAPGDPGMPLLEQVGEEFSLLTYCTCFAQSERRKVVCWALDTAEALLAAGAPACDISLDVAAPWAWRYTRLVEVALCGDRWSSAEHWAFPDPFRAAARCLVLINSARGFDVSCSKHSLRRSVARQHQVRRSMPHDLLHHILRLAASPASVWVQMEPEHAF
ncbi:hypothetical protein ACK3TF_002647 [Chlorella vulgaris]